MPRRPYPLIVGIEARIRRGVLDDQNLMILGSPTDDTRATDLFSQASREHAGGCAVDLKVPGDRHVREVYDG